jgi:hypothetical protein
MYLNRDYYLLILYNDIVVGYLCFFINSNLHTVLVKKSSRSERKERHYFENRNSYWNWLYHLLILYGGVSLGYYLRHVCTNYYSSTCYAFPVSPPSVIQNQIRIRPEVLPVLQGSIGNIGN